MASKTVNKPVPTNAKALADAIPLHQIYKQKIFESGLKNGEVARALGYEKPNVVAMLKSGEMNLPATRVAAAARTLNIDTRYLLERVLKLSHPGVWEAIEQINLKNVVSDNEMGVIAFMRQLSGGLDIDYLEYDEFRMELETLMKKIRAREEVLMKAADKQVL